MWVAAKRLFLGVFLILLASVILLASDAAGRRRREQRLAGGERTYRVALFQLASRPIMDDLALGGIHGLRQAGIVDGQNAVFQRYNAEGDLVTASAIAQSLVDKDFDLILTYSTQCMQAMVAANQSGKAKHVFAGVVDPFSLGVPGLDRNDLMVHPPHLVGIGTMIPVREAIETARQMNPDLKTLGIVWNPAELNSELCTKVARTVCEELGITLVEAQVDNTASVLEAAQSLVSRGAEAFYLGGDNTVDLGFDSLKKAADGGRIPIFTYSMAHGPRGALFGIGANYFEVGTRSGQMAAEVLKGTPIAKVPIRLEVPVSMSINLAAGKNLRDEWKVTPRMVESAVEFYDESGNKTRSATKPTVAPIVEATKPSRRVAIVYFGPDRSTEASITGFRDGLAAAGYTEGKNLDLLIRHAQGEANIIPQIIQQVDGGGYDLIVPMTTPCLVGALANVRSTPIVFTSVYDPVAAGAGTSLTDHRPNLTGVGSLPPIGGTMDLIIELVPDVRIIGTLFNPSEVNSARAVERAKIHLAAKGLQLVEVPIVTSGDVATAVQVLPTRGVQAIWITGDNTALQAYPAIVKGALDAGLPLVNNDVEMLAEGSLASVGIGFYEAGRAAAPLAVRVLEGESPAKIPMENVAVTQLGLNLGTAKKLGRKLPPEMIRRVHSFAGLGEVLGRPAAVALMPSDTVANRADLEKALAEGLTAAGLRSGVDFAIVADSITKAPDVILATSQPFGPTPAVVLKSKADESMAQTIRRQAIEAARLLAEGASK